MRKFVKCLYIISLIGVLIFMNSELEVNALEAKETSDKTRFVKAAFDSSYFLVLKEDGYVYQSINDNLEILKKVDGLSNITSVSAGMTKALALRDDGTVWEWEVLKIKDFDKNYIENPIISQVQGLNDIITISSGREHFAAVKNDGTVWMWGDNEYGQLGNFSLEYSEVPIEVEGLENIEMVACGGQFTIALSADGIVYQWGRDLINEEYKQTSILGVKKVNGLPIIRDITSGTDHILALTDEGEVYSWGRNNMGQLGRDTQGKPQDFPQRVEGIKKVVQISAGLGHSSVLESNGQVWKWGLDIEVDNADINRIPQKIEELKNVKYIDSGREVIVALNDDNTIHLIQRHKRSIEYYKRSIAVVLYALLPIILMIVIVLTIHWFIKK